MRSLELSLDDVERPQLDDPTWDEYYLRDMAERFCLMFVLELTNKYPARTLVKAGFVQKWLARQEWGDEPDTRQRNFEAYMSLKTNRIVEIVNRIRQCRRGFRALSAAGLIAPVEPKPQAKEDADMVGEFGPGSEPHSFLPRTREHSVEEQRLRRQHREAMVLNDGTRPLGRGDIIERDHESST